MCIIKYMCRCIHILPSCTGLSITDLSYNPTSLNLTCTSTGGPIDSVTWSKDGQEISGSSSEFHQSQHITDRVTATYQHTLYSESKANFVGQFSCLVRDGRGDTATRILALNGVCAGVEEMLHEYPVPEMLGMRCTYSCNCSCSVMSLCISCPI